MLVSDITMSRYLRPKLSARIVGLKRQLDRSRPIPPTALRRLRDEIAVEWTYHSNAIEGSTLTLRETRLVLEHGVTVGGRSLREHLEAKNHEAAIRFLERLIQSRHRMVRERDLLDLHAIISKGIEEEFTGRYRTGAVRIVGASFIPPNAAKVPQLMAGLAAWMHRNPERLDVVELAAVSHYRFVAIHPFFDGNGRTARLLMNLLLMRQGYSPVVIPVTERKRYYAALERANHGDLGPFVNLMGHFVERALRRTLGAIGRSPEPGALLPLARLARRTPYSAAYLSLLARRGELAAEKRGKTWFSTSAAVREYQQRRLRKRA